MHGLFLFFVSIMLVAMTAVAGDGVFIDGFEAGVPDEWSEVVTPGCAHPSNENIVNCTVNTDIDNWVEPFEVHSTPAGTFFHDATQGHADAGCMAGELEILPVLPNTSFVTRSLCLPGMAANTTYKQGYFAKMDAGASQWAQCAIWAHTYRDAACTLPTYGHRVFSDPGAVIDNSKWYHVVQTFTSDPGTNSISFHLECMVREASSDTVVFDDLYIGRVPVP